MAAEYAINPQNEQFKQVSQNLGIFLISVLVFFEMLLIRWIGAEIRIFAYLQNSILVVCFLGLGIGCFTSRQPVVLRRMLGRFMDEHPRIIQAYSINVAGSLIGIWLFVLLSYLYQPPLTWFLVLAGLTAFFLKWFSPPGKRWWVNLFLLIVIVVLSWFAGQTPGAVEVVWSPYQKLVVTDMGRPEPSYINLGKSIYGLVLGDPSPGKEKRNFEDLAGSYLVRVNNTGYQAMLDLSDDNTKSNIKHFAPEMNGLSQYDIPLLLHPNPENYLTVGAGTGNDVAGGLRQNVKEITAVEIDPAIIYLGKEYHPEKPHASNVRIINDDARSYFAICHQKYDVISFGLLDSHTTTAMTNARLDHYVYTRESITRAKELLDENGLMVLTFEATKPFVADRMARMLSGVFGAKPISFRIPATGYGWGGLMFVAGNIDLAKKQIDKNQEFEI
jgi:spermidine synthase